MTDKRSRALTSKQEARTLTRPIEVRELTDGGIHLAGYASMTDKPYVMYDMFGEYEETIQRGAFKRTLNAGADVRLLLNHAGIPLARTKGGTMQLEEDRTGLAVSADLDPSSSLVRDVRSAMDRGDLDQMSFMFEVKKQNWEDPDQRMIEEVSLYDVSLVTFPANPATFAQMNSANLPAVEARAARTAVAALREGRALNPAEAETLQHVLNLFVSADLAADEGQEVVSALLGVANPDAEDQSDAMGEMPMETEAARAVSPLALYKRRLALL